MKPALIRLADQIDADLMALYRSVYNWVGTPGQVVNSFADFAKGPERLDHFGVPTDDALRRSCRRDHWGMLGSFTGLLRPGHRRDGAGSAPSCPISAASTPYMAQNVPAHTNGAGGSTGGNERPGQRRQPERHLSTVKDSATWSQSLITDDWDDTEHHQAGRRVHHRRCLSPSIR